MIFEVTNSPEIVEIAKALNAAQAEFNDAITDSTNPHFNSSYAGLDSVRAATKDGLAKNGLSLMQHPITIDQKLCLTTILLHTSGQYFRSTFQLNVEKPTMQGMKSAVTYARRTAWIAILGLAETDDDGNEAEKHPVADDFPSIDRAPHADTLGDSAMCCGRKMMISKYNPDELYCPNCKSKKPRV